MNKNLQKILYLGCGLFVPAVLILLDLYLGKFDIDILNLGHFFAPNIFGNWIGLFFPATIIFVIVYHLVYLKVTHPADKIKPLKSTLYFLLGIVLFFISLFLYIGSGFSD